MEGLVEDCAHYRREEAPSVSSAVAEVTGGRPIDVEQFARYCSSAFTSVASGQGRREPPHRGGSSEDHVGVDEVSVFRGKLARPGREGPYAGTRDEASLAYTLILPDEFLPWPGHQRVETILVNLELGISMSRPCWQWHIEADGRRAPGIDAQLSAPATWYVDLVQVEIAGHRVELLDEYIDIMVPIDGRQARMLDLDEFGDALEGGSLTASQAADGLRRWQTFLDRHLYLDSDPAYDFADFPPSRLVALARLHEGFEL